MAGGRARAVTAGALMLLLAYGPRAAMPYVMPSYLMATGIDREIFSTMLTTQSLVWGFSGILFGAMADQGHGRRIAMASALIYAFGLVLLAVATSPVAIFLGGGVLCGIGLGGATFTVAFAALSNAKSLHGFTGNDLRRSLAIITSAAATSALIFTPALQVLLLSAGAQAALLGLAASVAAIAPLALFLPGERQDTPPPAQVKGRGLRFALLFTGAMVSGFQTGFVSATLGVTLADLGLAVGTIVSAFLVLNLFNVFGAMFAGGFALQRSADAGLATAFTIRAVAFAAMLTLPGSTELAIGFAALAGLAWFVSLPLAAEAAAGLYGLQRIGLLTGLLFLGWQVGSIIAIVFAIDTYGWWGHYNRGHAIGLGLAVAFALLHLIVARRTHQPR